MLQAKQIPTSGRRTSFQVKQLGFNSVGDFATSLPKSAVVADVGAGVSRLGHETARLRPDITWVNIDPCYSHDNIRKEMDKDRPSNVSLYAEDIVKGFKKRPAQLRNGADLVYSYWLLPHLSLEDITVAEKACKNLIELLAPTGNLVIGPVRKPGLNPFSSLRYRGTVVHTKGEVQQTVINDIISKTSLSWSAGRVQKYFNRHNIHFSMRFIGYRAK